MVLLPFYYLIEQLVSEKVRLFQLECPAVLYLHSVIIQRTTVFKS